MTKEINVFGYLGVCIIALIEVICVFGIYTELIRVSVLCLDFFLCTSNFNPLRQAWHFSHCIHLNTFVFFSHFSCCFPNSLLQRPQYALLGVTTHANGTVDESIRSVCSTKPRHTGETFGRTHQAVKWSTRTLVFGTRWSHHAECVFTNVESRWALGGSIVIGS